MKKNNQIGYLKYIRDYFKELQWWEMITGYVYCFLTQYHDDTDWMIIASVIVFGYKLPELVSCNSSHSSTKLTEAENNQGSIPEPVGSVHISIGDQ